MDNIKRLIHEHQMFTKVTTAFIYAILVAIAMNFFWTPGHIYSSGITGFAQLINTITARFLPFTITTALALFLVNVPLFVLAWLKIGHQFTLYTFLCVTFASIMMQVLHPLTITTDPLICAIFGGAINGFGVGLCLKTGISTGGLDILAIVIQEKTGKSIGTINIIFNVFIILAAGYFYGWPYALYSAIGLVVNAKVMDMTYTRQQLMQVTLITNHPKSVIDSIQNHLHRGITILHDAEGAYNHEDKTVLITVISRYEMRELEAALKETENGAFGIVVNADKIIGNFYENKRK